MIEKINTRDYNNSLETKENLHKVKGVDTAGNDILVPTGVIAASGGCGSFRSNGYLAQGKWYRLAVGGMSSSPNSVVINIAKSYNSVHPGSQLLYVYIDGYSEGSIVTQLARGGLLSISKARVLFQKSTTIPVMFDIYISSWGTNNFVFSYSNNINFTFQTPVEVLEQPDAGYSVKEFAF